MRGGILALALALVSCAGPAARPWAPEATKYGFTNRDIVALERDRILVTGETHPQVFSVYVDTQIPVFITSDSILHAFHVLYEASMHRLEARNARDLKPALRELHDHLAGIRIPVVDDPKLWSAAQRRARFVIAVALRLAGDDTFDPGDLKEAVERESLAVIRAEGMRKPLELGSPDREFLALDYRRFRPRGFYDSIEVLQKYFRSLAWLQAIPFRADRDEELVAFVTMGRCVSGVGRQSQGFTRFWSLASRLSEFLPAGISPDLARSVGRGEFEDYREETRSLVDVRKLAQGYVGKAKTVHQRSDQIRDVDFGALSLRIVAPSWTPELDLFAVTASQPGTLPSGLDVAAFLGSSLASELRPAVPKVTSLRTGDDPYREYLRCLEALADRPEPDAPAFMSSRAWSIKSCNTVTAGWAQLRHTMALHASPWVNVFGGPRDPVGFVEPDPEFFARLGRLAAVLGFSFRNERVLTPDMTDNIHRVKKLLALFQERDLIATPGNWTAKVRQEVEDLIGNTIQGEIHSALTSSDPASTMARVAERLKSSLIQMEDGQMPTWWPMKFNVLYENEEIEPQWARLEALCTRLEALAHKQLRGIELSAPDRSFISGYGHELSRIMLFRGSAWYHPPKSRPRVVDVASDPSTGRLLHVGIGRVRAMYVLYPSPSGDVLCRGAVVPYYELVRNAPMTDAEWSALLDSPEAPSTPEWFRPVESRTSTSVPEAR